ncbi:zeta toxin family protein [Longispora albida]|uniref:zeta toxin family protein n=1 Tax=Longispora albida TaxID=203523 RepID=UPI00035EE03E|nr:zeta toxin family protein [Longispora albida]
MRPSIILITGIQAAGKSTVAQLVAERLEKSVHVRGDLFRRMVIGGRAEPTPGSMPAEAVRQLRLTPRIGLWLDSSEQTPEQTADEILARLAEAAIEATLE